MDSQADGPLPTAEPRDGHQYDLAPPKPAGRHVALVADDPLGNHLSAKAEDPAAEPPTRLPTHRDE
jgi:hypothetical protein